MRVMVSLNLADIMTSTRPKTPKPLQEIRDNESDPTSLGREDPQPLAKLDHSECFDREPATRSTQV
jgi:hypothetical protein